MGLFDKSFKVFTKSFQKAHDELSRVTNQLHEEAMHQEEFRRVKSESGRDISHSFRHEHTRGAPAATGTPPVYYEHGEPTRRRSGAYRFRGGGGQVLSGSLESQSGKKRILG
jgi:hypothetical protein